MQIYKKIYMQKCCRCNKLIKQVNVSPIGKLITLSSQRNRHILPIAFAFRIQVNRSQRKKRKMEKKLLIKIEK